MLLAAQLLTVGDDHATLRSITEGQVSTSGLLSEAVAELQRLEPQLFAKFLQGLERPSCAPPQPLQSRRLSEVETAQPVKRRKFERGQPIRPRQVPEVVMTSCDDTQPRAAFSFDALPADLIKNSILPHLNAQEQHQAMATCKKFRTSCEDFRLEQARLLLQLESCAGSLSFYGIDCPKGVRNLSEAAAFLAGASQRLQLICANLPPEFGPMPCSALDMVLTMHPAVLTGFLDSVYDFSLCKIFADCANAPWPLQPEEIEARIKAWLTGPGRSRPLEQLVVGKQKLCCLPREVFSLASLRYLSVSGNSIAQIDPSIKNLVLLELLDLSDNCLKTVPGEIRGLNSLKALILSGNQIPLDSVSQLKRDMPWCVISA